MSRNSKRVWPYSSSISSKVIDLGVSGKTIGLCDVLVINYNFSRICYRFRDIHALAQVVFEILRSKRIGVTNLTFQGHVTSFVTWPFDSPYAISYWWSFRRTKPLSLTVSEIFNVKCNATVDVTLIRPLNKGQGHSFWYQSISHIRLPIGSQYSNFCYDAPISHNTSRYSLQIDRPQTDAITLYE